MNGPGRRHGLAVVVPARNEASRIDACLRSLAAQQVQLSVFLSDNASTDGTREVAAEAAALIGDTLDVTVRTVEPMGACAHFVTAMRWAMAGSDAEFFAILAGDDTWSPGFVAAALDGPQGLRHHPDVDVVFPAFTWGDAAVGSGWPPLSFPQASPARRQLVALLRPDHRELANMLYGVFRRSAFETLAAMWEGGGDHFGSDYAAAWALLGRHRVMGCPSAHGSRSVRHGVDLLGRVGHSRKRAKTPLGVVQLYVQLNLDINREIAAALRRVSGRPGQPATWKVQLVRMPQWCWGSLRQLWSAVSQRARRPG